jgi:spore maturation protein CgeB
LEVVELFRTLTPERAASIGQRARQRVLAQHTYEHRAAQVESLFESGALQSATNRAELTTCR